MLPGVLPELFFTPDGSEVVLLPAVPWLGSLLPELLEPLMPLMPLDPLEPLMPLMPLDPLEPLELSDPDIEPASPGVLLPIWLHPTEIDASARMAIRARGVEEK